MLYQPPALPAHAFILKVPQGNFLSGYSLVLRSEQPQKYTPSSVNWDQRFEKGISPRSPFENANFAQVVIAERNIMSVCAHECV